MPCIGGGSAIVVAAMTAVTAPTTQTQTANGLVVFTLVRGGSSKADFDTFVHSRRCLREAMPAWSTYDDVAFHEGNVPLEVQRTLRKQL